MDSTMSGVPPAKEIKFVNNQGQPPSKRRRINAACLTCRKRKTRCAGERPTCSTCNKNGHVCQGYPEVADKKKNISISSARRVKHEDDDGSNDPQGDMRLWAAQGRSARPSPFPGSAFKVGSRKGSSDLKSNVSSPLLSRTGPEWDAGNGPVANGNETTHRAGRPGYSSHGGTLSANRMPYFRYFGPTAIVPGFKQMVVSLSSHHSTSRRVFQAEGDPEYSLADLPTYDPSDSATVHPLILNLVKLFFLHVGANFPFWKEDKFLRLVQEKRVEPILVDSVCALAARYSDISGFITASNGRLQKWKYGNAFAQRAKERVPELFAVSSVGTVQAFLLLAYEAFGANQDSALWMYLGCAIRMAVDLGLPKLIGVQYQGEKDPWNARNAPRNRNEAVLPEKKDDEILSPTEQQEVEQERIDTVWSILVLDRAVSAGTGRLISLRVEEIELPLPGQRGGSGWPDPYPPFVQILHLYGRALDVLNNIEQPEDLTKETIQRLARMEPDLTYIYHKQDQRLRFDVNNFSEHAKLGQGPAFILLHLWFHALIIIIHQPTLLKPFRKHNMHQLAPKSREVAMSSAKSIADILAFSDLIDPHSFIGIPFTSQPMYIAACAFLMESSSPASQPPSRESTPPPSDPRDGAGALDAHAMGLHSLLVAKANDNYQTCYDSLRKLNEYWGGVKYILTALDQKYKGIWDCETYTVEEYESTKVPYRTRTARLSRFDANSSPRDPAVAYSMTGTANSPNPSITRLLFQNVNRTPTIAPPPPQAPPQSLQPVSSPVSAHTPPGNMLYDPIRQSLPDPPSAMFPPSFMQAATSAVRHSSVQPPKVPRLLSPPSVSSGVDSAKTQQQHSHLRYEGMMGEGIEVASSSDMKLHILGRNPSEVSRASKTLHAFTASQNLPVYDAASSILTGTRASNTHADHHQDQHQYLHQPQDEHAHQHQHQNQHHNEHHHEHEHMRHENPSGISGNPAGEDMNRQQVCCGDTATQNGLGGGGGGDFGANSAMVSSEPYCMSGGLSFDAQEVDISTLSLPGADMSSWYLPGDVVVFLETGSGSGNG